MNQPRLLDLVRNQLRVLHYSIRTEESYIHWIKRFIYFHNKRHPQDMSEAEVGCFLKQGGTQSAGPVMTSASRYSQPIRACRCCQTRSAVTVL